MKSIVSAGLLFLVAQWASGEVFEALRGIPPEMSVYVSPQLEGCPDSLDTEALAKTAEQELRQAKIEVVERHPATVSIEVTCLEVEEIDARVVAVGVQFWQPVIGKINDWNGSAPTWSAKELLHAFGVERDRQAEPVRAAVGELVEAFVRAYREANTR
jgi:hypothetical protein